MLGAPPRLESLGPEMLMTGPPPMSSSSLSPSALAGKEIFGMRGEGCVRCSGTVNEGGFVYFVGEGERTAKGAVFVGDGGCG